ncbi:MAG TPA: MFS transporter [Solirubrobacteraceae bacterium]|jgi:EmrB/QacA subfamily drug resistance transporter|nr:MFS transporter [Solirubrobacteraceae bacterium]
MSTIIKQRQRRTAGLIRRRQSPQATPQDPARAPEQRAPGGTEARHADAQITSSAAELASRSDRRRWVALAVLCLGQLMMVLDATIVNVALPSIQGDLHFSQSNLTWVLDGYLITFGGFLLLAGRLGDLVGRKRVFLTGLVMFTAASVLCGIADSQALLIGARLLQGVGGAVASSVILAIIVTEFPEKKEQAKAMGMYAFVSAGGGSIGLLAGGVLTQSLDWHWIFFVNVPIGIVAFVLGSRLIVENEGIGLGGGVDWLGSVLITLATMAGAFAIVKSSEYGLTSARTLGVGGTSLALLAGFLALESRLENPIMPLRILKLRSLMGSSLVRGFLITGMFSAFFLGSLYLERVLGYNAIQTGLAFLPLTVAIAVMSMGVAARIVERVGAVNTLVGGLAGIILGLMLLSTQGLHADYFPGLFFAFLALGLGAGASFLPLLTIGMADAPPRDAGLASGIVNVSVQLFGAIGLAALGTVATDHTKALSASGHDIASALTGGYHLAYVVAASCVAVGILAALLVLRPPKGTVQQEVEEFERELEREFAPSDAEAQLA